MAQGGGGGHVRNGMLWMTRDCQKLKIWPEHNGRYKNDAYLFVYDGYIAAVIILDILRVMTVHAALFAGGVRAVQSTFCPISMHSSVACPQYLVGSRFLVRGVASCAS